MFDQLPSSTRTRNTPERLYNFGPARTVTMEEQVNEELEMTVLKELVAAFPGFSLDDIAQAYTESDSDFNAAAILLSTRQPSLRSNGVQEGWTNLRKIDGYSRQSAELPVVKSDDLLQEKYGRGVGDMPNRSQSDSLFRNVQSTHGGVPHNAFHFNNRSSHGLCADSRSSRDEVVNNDDSFGVSGDGVLFGRKKQTGRGSSEKEVEVVDATRQTDEEFLVSMLGENSELGIAVVRDILDGFNGDTQQSLEVLLQMSSSTSHANNVDSAVDQYGNYCGNENLYDSVVPKAGNLVNSVTYQTSIKDKTDRDHFKVPLEQLKEFFPHIHRRDLFHALQSNNFVLSDAVQYVLDVSANKNLTSCPAEPNIHLGNRASTYKPFALGEIDSLVPARPPPLEAAWTDVKRTIVPLEQRATNVKHALTEKSTQGDNEYGRLRGGAHEHGRMMDYYFKEAAAAYDRGERCRAATLAEKGREHKQLAQEANGRASDRLFQSRNKNFVNNITIDLHAQHVKEAINVLKSHLQTLGSIRSVQLLTVITGYGSHSLNGRARIKPAVTNFLARSGIPWEELNEGCLTIKMVDAQDKELDMGDGE